MRNNVEETLNELLDNGFRLHGAYANIKMMEDMKTLSNEEFEIYTKAVQALYETMMNRRSETK